MGGVGSGSQRKVYPAGMVEAVRTMYTAGSTQSEIATALAVTEPVIFTLMRNHKIPTRPSGPRLRTPIIPVGEKFHLLTVLERSFKPAPAGKLYWVCRCDCGKVFEPLATHVRRGRTRSCGCQRVASRVRHGHTQQRPSGTYNSWSAMKRRCTDRNSKFWHHYGGRGISVCDRWTTSFDDFLADMGERPEGMTLDRINNDGNYEPANCRWATQSQQLANQRKRPTRTSDYPGVKYRPERSKWVAFYRAAGATHSLGSFATEEQAAEARQLFETLTSIMVGAL